MKKIYFGKNRQRSRRFEQHKNCNNCKNIGHMAAQCRHIIKCNQCNHFGHKPAECNVSS